MRLLISGFEPFGRDTVNPSQRLVEAIAARSLSNVTAVVLPVSYRRAEARLLELLRRDQPDLSIAFGLSRAARHLTFERFAFNLDDSQSADNDGERRVQRRIVPDAPDVYPSTLPFTTMTERARGSSVELACSSDPGRYVCNHVFFVTQHFVATELPRCRSGFVHVPFIDDAAQIETLAGVVEAWLL